MASKRESHSLSPAAARAQLSDLAADRSRLAGRIVTPWWYHSALGLLTVLLVTAPAMDGSLGSIFMALVVIGSVALPSIHTRVYGVGISRPTGTGTRTIGFALAGTIVTFMLISLAINVFDFSLWWVLVPAIGTFLAVLLLGIRYDRALRREIREITGAPE